MRWVICVLVALVAPGFVPCAGAADLDILRGAQPIGPPSFTRWSGFYLGGQWGYSAANADFSKATPPLIADSLRETTLEAENSVSTWPVLGNASASGPTFGGFVGYNTQWQDLILGIEANYSHSSFTTTANAPMLLGRVVSAGAYTDSVNVTGSGALEVTDYGSLRARAGWIVNGFLPYGFVGFVLGRGNYNVTTLVYGQQNAASPAFFPCDDAIPTCIDYSFPNSNAKDGALLYGFSAGGGVDVALTANVFVRGEFEYVQFVPLAGIVANIASARVGGGIKF